MRLSPEVTWKERSRSRLLRHSTGAGPRAAADTRTGAARRRTSGRHREVRRGPAGLLVTDGEGSTELDLASDFRLLPPERTAFGLTLAGEELASTRSSLSSIGPRPATSWTSPQSLTAGASRICASWPRRRIAGSTGSCWPPSLTASTACPPQLPAPSRHGGADSTQGPELAGAAPTASQRGEVQGRSSPNPDVWKARDRARRALTAGGSR